MSLYNLIYGVQPTTFFILPMLGKHPDQYPRFRDCFVGKQYTDDERDEFGIPVHKHGDEQLISVFTRVGGGNREAYQKEIDELRAMEGYVEDFDDAFDSTFATFVFKVPAEFVDDFELMKMARLKETSKAYQQKLYEVFPKLKDRLDMLLSR